MLDSRGVTPELVRVVIHAAGEIRSYERAALAMERLLGVSTSAKTIERLVGQVGIESADLRDSSDEPLSGQEKIESPPEVANVSCDGGRTRTRQMGQGPGVHGPLWRETQNSSFEQMTAQTSEEDPHPELPRAFCNPARVANIAENTPLIVESVEDQNVSHESSEAPQRLVRTCLSSMADADTFGQQMKKEAKRRSFYEAERRSFSSDGLSWNWSIWRNYFPTFTPILDFIHALAYVYAAAKAIGTSDKHRWACYLEMSTNCWQGQVDEVISAMRRWLQHQGIEDGRELSEDDPRKAVTTAVRYLNNNRKRMDYPRYRRMGLPVTSSPMESLIKQINYRVKGTEMFWNDPDGAEAILQVRAATLSDDDRLDGYLRRRPGWPYVPRSTQPSLAG